MTREIPCKIGDDVFAIQNFKGTKHIMKGKVSEMFFVGEGMDLCIVVYHIRRGYWGKDVFANYDDAEEYLNANRRST